MKRNELVKLATANGIKKASSTKSEVLISMLNEMGVSTEGKKKGRPINPTSARQLRLIELEEKRANGELKKGRPINEESARQKRLADLAAKAEENGGVVKRGRNIDPTSARQKRLAELAAKAEANGGKVKRGRPAQVKVEEVVDETATK